MPCRSPYDDDVSISPQHLHALNMATQFLCEILTAAERTGSWSYVFDVTPELKEWWEKHKEEDRTRTRNEQLEEERARARLKAKNKEVTLQTRQRVAKKAALLRSLTPEQRALLGYKNT